MPVFAATNWFKHFGFINHNINKSRRPVAILVLSLLGVHSLTGEYKIIATSMGKDFFQESLAQRKTQQSVNMCPYNQNFTLNHSGQGTENHIPQIYRL